VSSLVKVDLETGRAAMLVLDVQSLFATADGPFGNTAAAPMIDAIDGLLDRARGADLPVVHARYVLLPEIDPP
jgi:nicotinamidase-related amidase